MTLGELRNSFYADYKFECQKRSVTEIEIGNKQLALWISEAQQDIVNRIHPIKTYKDVSIVSGTTDYALDSDFGIPIRAEISGEEIDLVSLDDIITTGTLRTSSSVVECAVYWDSTNGAYYAKVYPSPTASATMRLWYYADTLFYSPSGSTAQDWGSFDGSAFSGDLKVPDKYLMAIKYFMLGKMFDDFVIRYDNEVRSLKGSVGDSMSETFTYKLGL